MTAVDASSLGRIGETIGAGGQGTVRTLPDHPGLLVKTHHREVDRAGLEALVRWRAELPDRARRIIDRATSWPLAVVELDDGVGVVLRAAPPRFFLDVAGQRRLRDLQWAFCSSVSYVGMHPVTPRTAVALVHRWACVLDVFHRHGVVYGDLSATNVLWSDLGTRPDIFVIDCDGAWVTAGPRAMEAGQTPLFDEPWASDGTPGAEQRRDRYKLGLLFLRLYYRSQVPVTDQVRRLTLPGDPPISRTVRDLLAASLQRDGARPGADAWIPALRGLESSLRRRGVA